MPNDNSPVLLGRKIWRGWKLHFSPASNSKAGIHSPQYTKCTECILKMFMLEFGHVWGEKTSHCSHFSIALLFTCNEVLIQLLLKAIITFASHQFNIRTNFIWFCVHFRRLKSIITEDNSWRNPFSRYASIQHFPYFYYYFLSDSFQHYTHAQYTITVNHHVETIN